MKLFTIFSFLFALLSFQPSLCQQARLLLQNGHAGNVINVTISKSKKIVASVSEDNTIILWDFTSGKKITTLTGHKGAFSLRFVRNDSLLVSMGDGKCTIWDVNNGTKLFDKEGLSTEDFSTDPLVLLKLEKEVTVWNSFLGKNIFTLNDLTRQITVCMLSPSGRFLFVGYGNGVMEIYSSDVIQGYKKLFRKKIFTHPVWSFSFLNDHFAFASDVRYDWWSYQGNTEVIDLSKIDPFVKLLPGYFEGFSPNGSYFKTVKQSGTIIWQTKGILKVTDFIGVSGELLNNFVLIDKNSRNLDQLGKFENYRSNYQVYNIKNRRWCSVALLNKSNIVNPKPLGETTITMDVEGDNDMDSTLIYDLQTSVHSLLAGKRAGSTDDGKYMIVTPKKSIGDFFLYQIKILPVFLKKFGIPAFAYPQYLTKTGTVLNIFPRSSNILCYRYDEALAKVVGIVTKDVLPVDDSDKSWIIRLEDRSFFNSKTIKIRANSKYFAEPYFYPRQRFTNTLLIKYKDSITIFDPGEFSIQKFVKKHYPMHITYLPSANLLGIESYNRNNTTSITFYKTDGNKDSIANFSMPSVSSNIRVGKDYILLDTIVGTKEKIAFNLKTAKKGTISEPILDIGDNFGNYIYGDTVSGINESRLISLDPNKPDIIVPVMGIKKVVVLNAQRQNSERYVISEDDLNYTLWDLKEGSKKIMLLEYKDEVATDEEKLLNTQYSGISQVYITNDERYILTTHFDNSIRQFDIATHKYVEVYKGHDGKINDLLLESSNNRLYSASEDGSVKCWDTNTGQCLVTHYMINNDWLSKTADGYFTSSQNSAEYFGLVIGTSTFELDQFDLIFNRPDIVLEKIGVADSSIIKLYRTAVEVRTNRIIRSNNIEGFRRTAPEVSILNAAEISDTVKTPTAILKFKIKSENTYLKSFFVTINGIPVNGKNGTNLALGIKNQSISYPLQFIPGKNLVAVYALNVDMVKSLVASSSVYYKPKLEIPTNLYILSVGVNNTNNSEILPLKFADKDAEDVVNLFIAKRGIDHVYSKLLIDKNAVKKNILEAKAFLQQGKANDIIIVFLSGHGTLGKDNKFYFCTYDISPNDPQEAGLSITQLEDLMADLPSRKKLMLIDACKSGVSSFETKISENVGNIKFHEKWGPKEFITIMNSTFANETTPTGITVIAASANSAVQYEKFKNGIFTNCLKSTFSDPFADTNGDRAVSINELCNYISSKLYERSNGDQRPIISSVLLGEDWKIASF